MMFKRQAFQVHNLIYKTQQARGGLPSHSKARLSPYVIGVCGGSGSGKTTFCQKLIKLLGEDKVLHISQDSYYKDLSHLTLEERAQHNFDHPDIIEFSLLTEHLDKLMLGKTIAIPDYDFSRHIRLARQHVFAPKPVVLVEGILLFSDPAIEKRLNHKIYIEASEEIRYERRLRRDVKERGRSADSVSDQFKSSVRPMHLQFVEPLKNKADQVISGELQFDHELLKLCLKILNE